MGDPERFLDVLCACHWPFLKMYSSSWLWTWYEHIDRAFALGFRLLSCMVTSSSQSDKCCTNK